MIAILTCATALLLLGALKFCTWLVDWGIGHFDEDDHAE